LISGFVIPFSVERLDRASFVRARAWRIVPTYAAGFLFTIAALLVAGLYYGNPFPYTAFEVADHLVPGLRLLLGSRFIDYVVWTLEIEVIFYLICAAIAPWLRDGSLLTFAVAVIALLCSFVRPDFHPEYLLALVFMLVGTVINFRARDRIDTVTAIMAGTFLLAASIAAMGLRARSSR
jgi:peptidoglycan/LPS O-acetylase OafA/YrhL